MRINPVAAYFPKTLKTQNAQSVSNPINTKMQTQSTGDTVSFGAVHHYPPIDRMAFPASVTDKEVDDIRKALHLYLSYVNNHFRQNILMFKPAVPDANGKKDAFFYYYLNNNRIKAIEENAKRPYDPERYKEKYRSGHDIQVGSLYYNFKPEMYKYKNDARPGEFEKLGITDDENASRYLDNLKYDLLDVVFLSAGSKYQHKLNATHMSKRALRDFALTAHMILDDTERTHYYEFAKCYECAGVDESLTGDDDDYKYDPLDSYAP